MKTRVYISAGSEWLRYIAPRDRVAIELAAPRETCPRRAMPLSGRPAMGFS